jgi:hypothetical protein
MSMFLPASPGWSPSLVFRPERRNLPFIRPGVFLQMRRDKIIVRRWRKSRFSVYGLFA